MNQYQLAMYQTRFKCIKHNTAFGSLIPSRTWQATNTDKYKFGMNGQEKDDEIYGEGNTTTAEYWEYDTRLGRRWNIDPIVKVFESSYSCFNDNPIAVEDIGGADGEIGSGDGKVNATIFVKFDEDANLTAEEKTTYLDALRKDIQGTWGSYTLPNGVAVDASTLVVSEAPENLQLKENENLITVGYGENDNNDYTRSRQISHVYGINNNKGYFYLKDGKYQNEGSHEFGHMLGLADRYHEAVKLEKSSIWKFGERSTVPMHLNDPGYDPQNNLMSGIGTGLTKSQFEVVTKKGSKEKSFTTALIIIDDIFLKSNYDAISVSRIHGVTTVKGYSGGLMDLRQTPSWAWRKNHDGKNDPYFFGFTNGGTMTHIADHAKIIEHNLNVVKEVMKFIK